jgi:hypothetical protein
VRRVTRHVLLTPRSMIDVRRAVSHSRAAIDLVALPPARVHCLMMPRRSIDGCNELAGLMFKHKRCNLPATYANRIGLPAKTLSCALSRR